MVGLAAEFYNMPIMAYLDHLRETSERYGPEAAEFDLNHALELRRLRIEKINEMRRKEQSS